VKTILSKNDPPTETGSVSPPVTNTVQCKLTVGDANDKYEQEADAVANKVMRMPDQSFIQRKCAHCEEEEKKELQRKPISQSITSGTPTKTDNAAVVSSSINDKIKSKNTAVHLLISYK